MKLARHEHLADDLRVDTAWWASLKLTAGAMFVVAALGGLALLGGLLIR